MHARAAVVALCGKEGPAILFSRGVVRARSRSTARLAEIPNRLVTRSKYLLVVAFRTAQAFGRVSLLRITTRAADAYTQRRRVAIFEAKGKASVCVCIYAHLCVANRTRPGGDPGACVCVCKGQLLKMAASLPLRQRCSLDTSFARPN